MPAYWPHEDLPQNNLQQTTEHGEAWRQSAERRQPLVPRPTNEAIVDGYPESAVTGICMVKIAGLDQTALQVNLPH